MLILDDTECTDVIVCDRCNSAKSWKRFRIRVGDGTTKPSTTCSTCRTAIAQAAASAKARLAKKQTKQLVLNRTTAAKKERLAVEHYYPDIERQMEVYCNKKTAMDRKYLRDHQHTPLSLTPHIAQKQQTARDHAKGWIAFYDDICNHAINLLRTTGTRPPWAQLEGSADLQLLYGVYRTRRAQQLRERG